MKARAEKYNELTEFVPKRSKKNEELYEEIKESELSNLSIGSNAKVIGNTPNQMDLEKIKEILEKNYQDVPKRRSIKLESKTKEEQYELEKTREYDINAILEKAREEKEVDYQEERLKKVRDTQYDILKNLNLEDDKNKASTEKTKEELLDLINTINLNEYQKKIDDNKLEEDKLDPLDILSDLKGNENTVVAGAKEFTENLQKLEMAKPIIKKEEKEEKEEKEKIDDSFYTSSMSFKKEDFADFDDLNADSKWGSIIIKILIVVVFIAIIIGVVLFLNDFLKLGWF